MQDAYDVLSYLPWTSDICGFDNSDPLPTVATYASRSWLTTIHEDQMLDLLRHDLLLRGSKAEIENMAFFPKLREGYNQRNTGQYNEAQTFVRARSVGEALVAGERDGLGMMANINDNHWVALAIDFQKSVISYGDPFNKPPLLEITSVVNWWTFHHTGQEFSYQKMKVSPQQDGFSCGLLSPNALGHFYLPMEIPLINTADVNKERVRVLLRVVKQHLDQVEVCQKYVQIENKHSH